MATTASAGRRSGITIVAKILSSPAPSTLAASSSSTDYAIVVASTEDRYCRGPSQENAKMGVISFIIIGLLTLFCTSDLEESGSAPTDQID